MLNTTGEKTIQVISSLHQWKTIRHSPHYLPVTLLTSQLKAFRILGQTFHMKLYQYLLLVLSY